MSEVTAENGCVMLILYNALQLLIAVNDRNCLAAWSCMHGVPRASP